MYSSYNAEDVTTPLVCVEAAYSAMQAAVIFYEGLRARSSINVDTLTELNEIKDSIRLVMLDSRGSRMLSGASLNNITASLRRLTSSLRGPSPRTSFSYPGQAHPSTEINEQLVQYLQIAQKWLGAAKSAPNDVQTNEGPSGSRPSVLQRNESMADADYYTTDYYCRL